MKDFIDICDVEIEGTEQKLVSPTLYAARTTKGVQKGVNYWRIVVYVGDLSKWNDINYRVPAMYYTEYGKDGGKKCTSETKTVDKPRNVGRKNEINPLSGAIIDARSEYNKRLTKGYIVDKDNVGSVQTLAEMVHNADLTLSRPKAVWRIYPEALHDYRKYAKKIKFPAAIQVKRDGISCVSVKYPSASFVDMYTRRGLTMCGVDQIREQLHTMFSEFAGLFLVGELYIHGASLQALSGYARDEKQRQSEMEYFIFDCFVIDETSFLKPKSPYSDRLALLKKIIVDQKYVHLVDTDIVNDADELEKIHTKHIEEYEGSVVRNLAGEYMFGRQKELRSYDTQKYKNFFDDEFEVVGYTTGEGKFAGLVIWICKTPKGDTFNVSPSESEDARREIYTTLGELVDNTKTVFDIKYKGKKYTVKYHKLSENGVPTMPVGKGFRIDI